MGLDVIKSEILRAKRILLCTHKQSDPDGLGCEIAMFYALKKMAKEVCIFNFDATPKKFHFMFTQDWIRLYESGDRLSSKWDLCLVFDTNDHRMLDEMYPHILDKCTKVLFLDHHKALQNGPHPPEGSWLRPEAASTGEMAYELIQALDIKMDNHIAEAIYTSISFDTHCFRYIKSSHRSHEIASQLLQFDFSPKEIHQHLFESQSIEKIKFISHALSKIDYQFEKKIAYLKISKEDLKKYNLNPEDTRDLADMLMEIKNIMAICIVRQDSWKDFKISLRSKGQIQLLQLAEKLGGGGHELSAGAFFSGDYNTLRVIILEYFKKQLQHYRAS